eukprot:2234125-Rhodomonas_salina.3
MSLTLTLTLTLTATCGSLPTVCSARTTGEAKQHRASANASAHPSCTPSLGGGVGDQSSKSPMSLCTCCFDRCCREFVSPVPLNPISATCFRTQKDTRQVCPLSATPIKQHQTTKSALYAHSLLAIQNQAHPVCSTGSDLADGAEFALARGREGRRAEAAARHGLPHPAASAPHTTLTRPSQDDQAPMQPQSAERKRREKVRASERRWVTWPR